MHLLTTDRHYNSYIKRFTHQKRHLAHISPWQISSIIGEKALKVSVRFYVHSNRFVLFTLVNLLCNTTPTTVTQYIRYSSDFSITGVTGTVNIQKFYTNNSSSSHFALYLHFTSVLNITNIFYLYYFKVV